MNKAATKVTVTDMNICIFRKTKPKMPSPGRVTDPRRTNSVKREPF